eukprot:TRINITY_DN6297_c0_g1_i2.p1 TRINITY_DN6297_c0_g1~~TRINITY_DN6297_c0_g1_i2.p1  ORF type:complete len:267 (-),score=38.17 TRINITY_DN6297_c0_g1_i2:223-1023(-)
MRDEDGEILREVWEGRIPAVFTLADQDKIQDEEMPPCYLMLPRMSYLPLITEKLAKHFQNKEKSRQVDKLWLDYKGTPLKWHHPIGALFDKFKGLPLDNDEGLPWKLTIHFSDFPDQEVVPCHSREQIESYFMSCLKEADQLKHGGRVMSLMQKKDHVQLWSGLQNDKFDQFWAINRKLMETSSGEFFKHIPIRFHIVGSTTVQQKLIKPVSEETGELLTFGNLNALYSNSKLIVQGIQPAPETPVQWLSEHLSYPDNFLHIAVHQ